MRPCLHLDYKSNLVFHNDICTVVALHFTVMAVMVLPARYYCSRWIGRYLVHGWEAWTVWYLVHGWEAWKVAYMLHRSVTTGINRKQLPPWFTAGKV